MMIAKYDFDVVLVVGVFRGEILNQDEDGGEVSGAC
jgi:hypothetical protein